MISSLRKEAGGTEFGWTRVSSFKPCFLAVLLTGFASACLMVLLRKYHEAVLLITAGTAIGFGVIALNCKVVHRRGNEYRITTLFYSEVVKAEDVCMTITHPGPFWTRFRIHLKRPARFGWRVSFISADEAFRKTGGKASPSET